MNRAWKAAMELLDVGAIRRNDPTDVARFTPTGSGYMGPGGDYAVRRIIEELARARSWPTSWLTGCGRPLRRRRRVCPERPESEPERLPKDTIGAGDVQQIGEIKVRENEVRLHDEDRLRDDAKCGQVGVGVLEQVHDQKSAVDH